MTLKRVYAIDFNPSGGPMQLKYFSANGQPDPYVPMARYTSASPVYHYAYVSGSPGLAVDLNHSQRGILFLPCICYGLNPTINLRGGELRTETWIAGLSLDKRTRWNTHAQFFVPSANDGRSASVNIYSLANFLDEAHGFAPPATRGANGEGPKSSTGWVSHTTVFTDDDSKWAQLHGRDDKYKVDAYGSAPVSECFDNGMLLNVMQIFNVGPNWNQSTPFTSFAGLYWRKWEIWVDADLNPNAVEV